MTAPTTRRPRATILIATMWILVVLTGLVLVLARTIRVEGACSANHAAAQQAAAIESGAVQYVIASLDGLDGRIPTDDDMPCQGVQVGGGAFWIIRADPDDDRELTFGLLDEASKVNVNTAASEVLAGLPEMTLEAAAAIIDWRDGDSELSVGGAESEYYLLLAEPYECKNAPLETVEELLLVRSVTPELLFGEDANRNGALDDNENDADSTDPPDDRDGSLDPGLYPFVTVYSYETADSQGPGQKVNVNQASTAQLSQALSETLSGRRLASVVSLARLGRPFANLFDFYYRTGLKIDEFKPLADRLTTGNQQKVTGLVNVNTARREVLLCLPGLDESDVAGLLSARSAEDADTDGIAWVVEALPQAKAVGIGSLITGRSYQFSADIVSVAGNGRAFRRCRIVVDAAVSPPRVVYRQDLTPLGWPLSQDILELLRTGTPIEDVLDETYREVP